MSKLEIGCHGDGSLGHDHTRVRCAMLLEALAWDQDQIGNTERARLMREISHKLRQPMSDDGCEETEACIFLDDTAYHPEAWWGWQNGDFGLWSSEEA